MGLSEGCGSRQCDGTLRPWEEIEVSIFKQAPSRCPLLLLQPTRTPS